MSCDMQIITSEQLDKIEKLAEAATPGPWSQEVWQGNANTGGWAAVGPHQESTDCICEREEDREECAGEYCADERSQNDEEQAWKDAAFIRAMRQHTLPLVKAVREARVLNPPNGYFEDIDRLTKERDAARAEVEMLRGVGCGELREGAKIEDGPCGACLKCARRERDAATEELIAASREIEQIKAERDEARADRDDTLAILARVAEQLGVSGEVLAEDPTLVERRIVGLLAGLNAASRAEQERDEARAEVERLKAHLRHIAYEHCDSPVHYAMNQLEDK